MKRLLIVGFVLACAASVAAGGVQQDKPKQKPDDKAVDVTGKWTMSLDMSMGTATPALELMQNGTTITGTYTGRFGASALKGTLKDGVIQFSFQMGGDDNPQTMSFSGQVAADGQSMKGTATLGEMGDATWSATRDKTLD